MPLSRRKRKRSSYRSGRAGKRRYRRKRRRRSSKKSATGGRAVSRVFNSQRNSRGRYSFKALGRLLKYQGPSLRPNQPGATLCQFKKVQNVKLKYYGSVTLGLNTSNSILYEVRMNDLYDPNKTGVGSQPHGFDQWMALYNKYIVVGSKCTWVLRNAANTTKVHVYEQVYNDAIGGTPITDHAMARASTNVHTALLSGSGENDGQEVVVLTSTYTPRQYVGIENTGTTQAGVYESFVGKAGATVNKPVTAQLDGVTTSGNFVNLSMVLEYYIDYSVVFFEAKQLGFS